MAVKKTCLHGLPKGRNEHRLRDVGCQIRSPELDCSAPEASVQPAVWTFSKIARAAERLDAQIVRLPKNLGDLDLADG